MALKCSHVISICSKMFQICFIFHLRNICSLGYMLEVDHDWKSIFKEA